MTSAISPALSDVPATATVLPIALRWSDMDPYQHVNNVQYLRLLEEARVFAFKDWFGQNRDVIDEGILVVSQSIDYLVPMVFDYQPAQVALWCCEVTGVSFELGFAIGMGQEPTVHARGRVNLVAYDLKGNWPRPLGETMRAALEAVRGPAPVLREDTRRRRRQK